MYYMHTTCIHKCHINLQLRPDILLDMILKSPVVSSRFSVYIQLGSYPHDPHGIPKHLHTHRHVFCQFCLLVYNPINYM